MNIQLAAQDYLPLYPDEIPNSIKTVNEEKSEQWNGMTIVSKISIPTIRYFPAPEKNCNRNGSNYFSWRWLRIKLN